MARRKQGTRAEQTRKVINSGYGAGGASQKSNVLKGWRPLKASPKSDIDAHLFTLRNRAADEAINTPIGAAAIKTSAMHTVGDGLHVFPRVKFKTLGLTPEQARDWTRKTVQEFEVWAGSKDCDITRRNNFYDMQDIMYTSYLTDGDAFALFKRRPQTKLMPYSLRVQILEANRVSNPMGADYFGTLGPYAVEMQAPNPNNRIISGVEINKDGAVVAYWVSNRVPWDPVDVSHAPEWVRVEAFGRNTGTPNVLQVCHDLRPEQYRGVPYLAPVVETLKQVTRYTNAELTSAIVKSFFALFFTEGAAGQSIEDVLPGTGIEAEDARAPIVDPSEYSLAAGTMNALPKGVDVKTVDASNSMSTFDQFVTQLFKQIGAAIGQPYEVLIKSFNSSYSASRAALLQAWDEYKIRRKWFARDFCQPIYEEWLTEAVAIGRIQAPGFFDDPVKRAAWCNADWFGPAMSILEPVKDVTGSALRTKYGLSTREREAAEMTGTDLEENLEQLAYEKKVITELGLDLGNPEVLAGKEAEQDGGDTTKGGENNGQK